MTQLTRWSPFSVSTEPFGRMRTLMDRFFNEPFPAAMEPWSWEGGFTPLAVDVYENENDLVVKASLPGVRSEDLDVSLQGTQLTIRGQTQEEHEEQRGSWHVRERRAGSFHRTLQLSVPVNGDGIEARYENGVLTVRLPKADEARERKIQVNAPAAKQIKAA